MSKELIRSTQYRQLNAIISEAELTESPELQQELAALYGEATTKFQPGKLISGTIKRIDQDGILVDINYKSDGLIPKFEFGPHELKKFKEGDLIEVILDELENVDGNVILSYEKAKALKAWDEITKLYEENKPVEGLVTHKVKGGLSIDLGVPAFLPGSQIDVQRVTDFDQYVGQVIQALIIKINRKRGNVIISRRKLLTDQRAEARGKVLDVLTEGQVIRGTVKNITNYGVFIDIGGVDGLLHITDMTWGRISHPSELVKIGDPITVKVLSIDKQNEKISLGLKQLSENPWQQAAQKLKVGDRVTGKISSITDYGLFVEVMKGVEGLVHISEISWTDRIADLHKKFKVGDEIEVLIVSLDADNRRMSLSIKQLEKNPWESITEQFKEGQVITGTVSNVTDFGVFVQLIPGVDGLVHISDLSWTEHIDHPSSLFKRGDSVQAIILGIDQANKKISLGIKQLAQDPWDAIQEHYPVGSIVEGEVSRITNFGAFVKLASGIEGLVHISELSDQNVEKVEDILKIGEKRQFKVINLNKEERKLGLSLKLEDRPTREVRESRSESKARSDDRSGAKREKKAQAPRSRRSEQAAEASSPSKAKSALQIALEEHAARQSEANEDNE
ncbi:30S ribosomal protein S1 [Candidatus Dependentiae bacterium]|nr:30S ribosomal protein S1 [Candidatus Dependentiae bacterium]